MNRSLLQDYLARKMGACLGLGGALWMYLLIVGALSLRNYSGDIHYDVRVGPMLLNTLNKYQLPDDGYAFDFYFQAGMIWYAATCCALGAAWGGFRYVSRRKQAAPKE